MGEKRGQAQPIVIIVCNAYTVGSAILHGVPDGLLLFGRQVAGRGQPGALPPILGDLQNLIPNEGGAVDDRRGVMGHETQPGQVLARAIGGQVETAL